MKKTITKGKKQSFCNKKDLNSCNKIINSKDTIGPDFRVVNTVKSNARSLKIIDTSQNKFSFILN